jgi:predicted dehydrogenase
MKIGTVGTNVIVSNFIEAARLTGKAEIAAVYSRSAETAAGFAEKHGVKKHYSGRAAFLGDGGLDFIYVASPNSLHFEWTRDALMSGRNVICEKPFVSREAELRELTALAKEKGLFLFEGMMTAHLPNYRAIKERVSDIGPVRMAQLSFSQYSSRYAAFLRGESPNVFSAEFSGGALMDLNCYNINFAVGLFGEPDGPEGARYFPNMARGGIDISGVMLLKYPGFVCVCASSKASGGRNFIEIQGEKGFIASTSECSHLRSGVCVSSGGREEFYDEQDQPNVIYYEIMDFAKAFDARDFQYRDRLLEQSLAVARIIERGRKEAGIFFAADREKS